MLVVYPIILSVYAVLPNNTTTATVSGNGQLPKIMGSINLMQVAKDIVKGNPKVFFQQQKALQENRSSIALL
jgi:hypothetical protein